MKNVQQFSVKLYAIKKLHREKGVITEIHREKNGSTKNFRANQRGVKDVKFFLFRIEKLLLNPQKFYVFYLHFSSINTLKFL
jgi:hypothetical protein